MPRTLRSLLFSSAGSNCLVRTPEVSHSLIAGTLVLVWRFALYWHWFQLCLQVMEWMILWKCKLASVTILPTRLQISRQPTSSNNLFFGVRLPRKCSLSVYPSFAYRGHVTPFQVYASASVNATRNPNATQPTSFPVKMFLSVMNSHDDTEGRYPRSDKSHVFDNLTSVAADWLSGKISHFMGTSLSLLTKLTKFLLRIQVRHRRPMLDGFTVMS